MWLDDNDTLTFVQNFHCLVLICCMASAHKKNRNNLQKRAEDEEVKKIKMRKPINAKDWQMNKFETKIYITSS